MMKEPYTKTLVKTLEILKSFDDYNTHQKASEIARKLNLNISTVLRHLSDLVNYGFLEQDQETTCYYLGPTVINLAGVALNSHSLYSIAYSEVLKLSRKLDVHVNMSILKEDQIIYLFEVPTENSFDLLMPIGYKRPAATAAMGRVLLAGLKPQTAYYIVSKTKVNKLTPYSLTSVKEIMLKIDSARDNGYSVLTDEIKVGISSISAPVRNRSGEVVAAVATSIETSRLTNEFKKEIIDQLLITVSSISAKLGYFPR